jgi:hypothetical protein
MCPPPAARTNPYLEVATYGSEMNFLHSLTPKVLPGVIGGIAAVFKAGDCTS